MAATAVLESVWLYSVMAVFGVMLGQSGSPLSWVAAIAVLGVSLIVARTLAMILMQRWLPYVIQMVVGSLVVYVTIAAQVPAGGQGFDLGWASSVSSDTVPVNYPFRVGFAVAIGALLWWRGGRLASVDDAVGHLNTNFRVGIIVLGVAAVVDMVHSADLKIFPVMFVFFASGLVGLSLANLLPASRRTAERRAWPRVIAAVVGVVMAAGLLFGLLKEGMLAIIATPFVLIFKAVATVMLFVVVLPTAYILEFLMRALVKLIALIFGEPEPVEREVQPDIGERLRSIVEETLDTGPSTILQVIEFTLVALVVLVVLYVLARAFRRKRRWRWIDQEGMRESVSENVDPAYDMARLLLGLLPDRFRKKSAERRLRLPDDDSGIVEVFRVYFGMLTLAEDRGRPRRPNQTPTEYQASIERVFPRNMVQMATAAFNRACYGRQPATPAELSEMRGALERAAIEGKG